MQDKLDQIIEMRERIESEIGEQDKLSLGERREMFEMLRSLNKQERLLRAKMDVEGRPEPNKSTMPTSITLDSLKSQGKSEHNPGLFKESGESLKTREEYVDHIDQSGSWHGK